MSTQEVINTVNDFLVDEFEIEKNLITPDANLQETLELDSLDYVDLVVVIENNFGFKTTGEDFKDIRTIQDFYNFIIKKVGAN